MLSVSYRLRYLFAAKPQVITKVLAIVHRVISSWLIRRAGLIVNSGAQTGAVTLLQHFGSALNANLHFHILFINLVYEQRENSKLTFHRVKAPSTIELNSLVAKISQRIARHLEKQGLLTRDDENSYLTMDGLDDNVINELQSHSITYRIAMGPQQGRKIFKLQTIPAWVDDFSNNQIGNIAGFSSHAGVTLIRSLLLDASTPWNRVRMTLPNRRQCKPFF